MEGFVGTLVLHAGEASCRQGVHDVAVVELLGIGSAEVFQVEGTQRVGSGEAVEVVGIDALQAVGAPLGAGSFPLAVELELVAAEIPLAVAVGLVVVALCKVAGAADVLLGDGTGAVVVVDHIHAVVTQVFAAVGAIVDGLVVLATVGRVGLAPVEDDVVGIL